MYNMNKADIIKAAEAYAGNISFNAILRSARQAIIDAYLAGVKFARGEVLDD